MILIDDKIISLDLFTEYFLCHYEKCRGACCIEGESGAPLEKEEVKQINELLPKVMDMLSPEAQQVIKQHGVSYIDESGDEVTTLVNGGPCVFALHDEGGHCLCAFEKLFREGKSSFIKPQSCHLYPIRLHQYSHATALNYDRWDICQCAVVLGKRKKTLVYQALKEPLIRVFGEPFYKKLEACHKHLEKENQNNESRKR